MVAPDIGLDRVLIFEEYANRIEWLANALGAGKLHAREISVEIRHTGSLLISVKLNAKNFGFTTIPPNGWDWNLHNLTW
jgi:hypothetical protein